MIILYTTGCPMCNVLREKLDAKQVPYQVETDIEVMMSKGMLSAPHLEVDGVIMKFEQANSYVNSL